MRALRQALYLLLFWSAVSLAAVTPDGSLEALFPALTGRVVDNAGLLDAATRRQLNQTLQAQEQATGDQLVVVTLPGLKGANLEEFGYRLGRYWGIGQKDKNNGALLIVVRDERKVRIEVGYGLEDRLTDAQTSVIINQVIIPAFKTGDYNKGIRDGVSAILQVIGGQSLPEPAAAPANQIDFAQEHPGQLVLMIVLVVLAVVACQFFGGFCGALLGLLLGGLGRGGGGGFGGSSGGGGFSGGGGSFGGGGSSGSW